MFRIHSKCHKCVSFSLNGPWKINRPLMKAELSMCAVIRSVCSKPQAPLLHTVAGFICPLPPLPMNRSQHLLFNEANRAKRNQDILHLLQQLHWNAAKVVWLCRSPWVLYRPTTQWYICVYSYTVHTHINWCLCWAAVTFGTRSSRSCCPCGPARMWVIHI